MEIVSPWYVHTQYSSTVSPLKPLGFGSKSRHAVWGGRGECGNGGNQRPGVCLPILYLVRYKYKYATRREEIDDRKRKIENRKRMRALQKQGSVQWQAAISGYTSSSRSGAGSHSLLPPYDSDVYFPKRSRKPSASLSLFFFSSPCRQITTNGVSLFLAYS